MRMVKGDFVVRDALAIVEKRSPVIHVVPMQGVPGLLITTKERRLARS